MVKCQVCDWEIKDGGVKVKIDGKEEVFCCKECAEKAQKAATAKPARRA